ncbi:2-amino-4-hydroxy-6-hydroxymethyldihydropteridine diphosphokinase [Adhaeribacter pallidiroseus]|uniref:2-amino-4-hydroxy-6-hydroxymethyldihydropteridine pyrophosphokinase n=1 Tax=Adhaeribacter pallidiroseus TaxID=2072847 RepID=A0A369QIW2_9BACT|nr:2-amino-4-hydroxy-6-hydroxymethyldihydropteridine diphosphokinase [Adhaeribacter pallidiroseus]RDC64851.1 2-amino-4-hydroxy-6-hydroxymethyldihydropteridine diphosphokinase [Adhaeribacter pallidiroseus]
MPTTYLLLGSNLGNRLDLLKQARDLIAGRLGAISQLSGIYETAAWGLENQQAFLNQVLAVETTLMPEELLRQINNLEAELGRVRLERWGARVIDIDILYYDQLVLQTQRLTVPHPELQNRRFTLVPLVQIVPDFVHPALQQSNLQLLEQCPDQLPVTLLKL